MKNEHTACVLGEEMNAQLKVLVIDDDEGIRTTISAILENEGYDVDTAENGKEAIEKSKADLYKVVRSFLHTSTGSTLRGSKSD
jgi:CheY-like chemotaxis protein